jgi:hypothetical protein
VSRKTPPSSHHETRLAYLGGKKKFPLLKEETWRDDAGEVTRYSLAYIDPLRFQGDNGRILGYDNAHGHHHRHFCGVVTPVHFTGYEQLARQFEHEADKLRRTR